LDRAATCRSWKSKMLARQIARAAVVASRAPRTFGHSAFTSAALARNPAAPRRMTILALGCGSAVVTAVTSSALPACRCDGSGGLGSGTGADALMDVFKMEYATEFGLSGFCGYAAGFAIKRAAQAVVFTTGCLFVAMQVMANHGYVTVHWEKIERDWKGQLDQDGDGALTARDMNSTYQQLSNMLEHGLPGAAGFGSGLLMGLRS